MITLLCVLFIAIAGVALPARLTQSRYGRILIGALGLSLGFALYRARDYLHFNFEAFGFIGYALMILVFGLVFYGLTKFGVAKDISFPLTYCVMFFSLNVLSPSIFDVFAKSLPILNLIAFGCFFYLLARIIMKMFSRKPSLAKEMRHLEAGSVHQVDEREIEREIKGEEKEETELARYLTPLTIQNLHSVDNLEIALKNVLSFLARNRALTEESKLGLVAYLRKLAAAKEAFAKRLKVLRDGLDRNQRYDKKQLHELRTRMKKTADKRKKVEIQKEWLTEKKKLELFDFIFSNEKRINGKMGEFESCLGQAVHGLTENNIPQAGIWIKKAQAVLNVIGSALRRIGHFESYLRKAAHQVEERLKNERDGR